MNDAMIDQMQRYGFLGPEFLLWLWYRFDTDGGRFAVDGEPVDVIFDNQLTLEGHLAEAETSRLSGGLPANSPEAYQALRVGKRVAKARIRLAKGANEWTFVIDTETFNIGGLKVPQVPGTDKHDQIIERFYMIEELDRLLDDLYKQFLEHRIGAPWKKEFKEMAEWVNEPVDDA